ncbi:flagellar protein FlaG [Dissulfurirhabdus thermomarina]|uniref:Flagellar protein FlaG n=1 Tax=Dissulfurirhabdus thermomarina TaxID=1765737 RepID=A0A6N9TPI9_DISTH|nr:flagellar protein FlaG [Dissulfurirhabdus thermomarina]NDY43192.1 flagellar protein FlaG [Dissulfurirhabdus thermomarina]NMX24502.1 flagellar protein FlaG [Dissulfurirhabdus thermomarina]
MDSKGIQIPGTALPPVARFQPEARDAPAIRPVDKAERNGFQRIGPENRKPPSSDRTGRDRGASLRPGATAEEADLVDRLARQLENVPNLEVRWTVLEETGTLVVQIVDKETGEVVRQIPPEELIRTGQKDDLDPGGLLVDKRA